MTDLLFIYNKNEWSDIYVARGGYKNLMAKRWLCVKYNVSTLLSFFIIIECDKQQDSNFIFTFFMGPDV